MPATPATPEEIENPFPRRNCFLCGADNPASLRLRFFRDGDGGVFCEYRPEERFAGQGDILHGAIQMGLLDEAMGWASFAHTGTMGVTMDMAVRFHRPAYISAGILRASARVEAVHGRDVRLAAGLADASGQLLTSASGVYRLLSPERYAALVGG